MFRTRSQQKKLNVEVEAKPVIATTKVETGFSSTTFYKIMIY